MASGQQWQQQHPEAAAASLGNHGGETRRREDR